MVKLKMGKLFPIFVYIDSLQQILMDDGIGGDDTVASEEMGRAVIVGDTTASLEDDEGASHEVPLADVALGVGVETTCGDVTEGHSGGANHADATDIAVEMGDETGDNGHVGIAVIGQLQAEQGIADGAIANVNRSAVHPGAAVFPGIETFVSTDVIDHADQYLIAANQGDGYSIRGEAMNKIGGAVEWINHPQHLLVAMRSQSFFGDEAGLGQQLSQGLDDALLRPFVDIRHVVVGVLLLYPIYIKVRAFLFYISPSLTCNLAHAACQFL